jgi:ADP-ribose pyrophosphatase
VRQDEIRLPNGQSGIYNTVVKEDAVWIVPVTSDGHIAMIFQYRYTVDDWCWEVPAGSVKPGQSLEEAVRDELREEVGGEALKLEYIGRYYPANGICNEVGHIYLATGVTIGRHHHEAAEVIQIHVMPIAEVLAMARSLQIADGPSALALLMCAGKLEAIAIQG